MAELNIKEVKNLDNPMVQELLNLFKKRNEMNVVDVAEIINKLITTLQLDHDSGRPKEYGISGGHLGQILGIGKGVVSQYLSVWNMSQESKNLLHNYNVSLINAYQISRIKGKDEVETVKFQKEKILEDSKNMTNNSSERKLEAMIHTINKASMIINGIIISNKIPSEHIKTTYENDIKDNILRNINIHIENINNCINYICPKISKLPFYHKELEFCNILLEYKIHEFCGFVLNEECIKNLIVSIKNEINSIEEYHKLPNISSLMMMRNELESHIK